MKKFAKLSIVLFLSFSLFTTPAQCSWLGDIWGWIVDVLSVDICNNTTVVNNPDDQSGDVGTEEPVNLTTGNMYLEYKDISIASIGPDLILARRYNSQINTHLEGFERSWGQSGSWAIENGEFSGEGGRIYTNKEFADFTFEADMKTITAGNDGWETSWIDFRYTDNSNYYYFLIKEDGTLELSKIKGGQQFWLIQNPSSYSPFDWHKIKIVTEDNNIKIHVDGNLEINYLDNDSLSKGKIGLNSSFYCHAHYDNLNIYGSSIFKNDFNESMGWTKISGDWTIENQLYKGVRGLSLTESNWGNFNLQAKMRTIEAGPNPWENAWVRFRYTDWGNGYYFLIQTDGVLELTKFQNYQQSILVQQPSSHNPLEWNDIRIVTNNENIKIYVNGSLEIDYNDASPILDDGKIGLDAFYSTVNFDDITVWDNFNGLQNDFNNINSWQVVYGGWNTESGVFKGDTGRVISDRDWNNFTLDLDIKTSETGSNPWETAWVDFRYTDPGNQYYFLLKTDGFVELSKFKNYQKTCSAMKEVLSDNLSLGHTAISSSDEGELAPAGFAIDGNAQTRWSSQHSDSQWITIDLESERMVNKVKLNWETAYGKSYKIQVSQNNTDWTDVYSTTSGDGEIDEISFPPVDARYVRMYGEERGTEWGYSLWEFEVFGAKYDPRGWNHVKIHAENENIKIYINGNLEVDYIDSDPLTEGKVGLEAFFSRCEFDNILIKDNMASLVYSDDFNRDVTGMFGFGWESTYDARITEFTDGTILLHRANGAIDKFTKDYQGSYIPPKGEYTRIQKTAYGYSAEEKDGLTYNFNADGKLTEVVDLNGNKLTLFYNGSKLAKVADASGRELTFSYGANGKVSTITDPAGNVFEYRYNNNNLLVESVNPLSDKRTYEYDPLTNNMTMHTSPNGYVFQTAYSYNDKTIKQIDPFGNETLFDYLWDIRISSSSNGTLRGWEFDNFTKCIKMEVDPLGNKQTYTWDEDRNMTSKTDANGNTSQYTYDEAGNNTSIEKADGSKLVYTYDTDTNKITGKSTIDNTDTVISSTTFEYDNSGNLTRTTDAKGGVTEYLYDNSGLISSKTDANGNTATFEYDNSGNVAKITGPLGNSTLSSYDSLGNKTSYIDANGNTTAFEYNDMNCLTKITNPLGAVTEYTYDANGNRLTEKDPNGNITNYTYDAYCKVTSITDPEGNTTLYKYNSGDTMITGASNLTNIIDPENNINTYTYDLANQLTSEITSDGKTIEYNYDPNGNRTSITDSDGNTTAYTYDDLNRVIQITDPENHATTYSYDSLGNKTSVTDEYGTTTFDYDELSRLVEITDPLGNETSMEYDAVGNKITETDAQGNTTAYEYDADNKLTAVTNSEGNTTTYEYDAVGNLITEKGPEGNETSYEYNANSQLVATTDPSGSETENNYDLAGNMASSTDANGNTTYYEYNSKNQLIKVTGPLGNITTYTYDSKGNRTSITDANGNATAFVYNSTNKLIRETDPLGNVTQYTYDLRDNILSKTDSNGNIICYTYDSMNRIINKQYPDGTKDEYIYNSLGKIETEKSPCQELYKQYDTLGRLISITYMNTGQIIQYGYDSVGNRIKRINPEGGVTTYTYDSLKRVKTITNPEGETTSYEYNASGKRNKVIYVNGTYAIYNYNEGGRLASLINYGSKNEILSKYECTYDAAGNRIKAEELNKTILYTYDALNQLTGVNVIDGKDSYSISYSYDVVGNRKVMEIIGDKNALDFEKYAPSLDKQPNLKHPLIVEYTYNEVNQLINETAIGIKSNNRKYEINYTYDSNGNMVKKSLYKGNKGKDALITQYEYDYYNKIKSIIYPDGELNEFVNCTCLFKRLEKKDSSGVTKYFYDNNSVLMEFNGNGLLIATYTLGPRIDEIISKRYIENGEYKTIYYHYDGLGSVRQLTDKNGKIKGEYDYLPFGKIIETKGGEAKKNAYTYVGREYDRDSGLYYYRARYSNPRIGRFMTKDPILNKDFNLGSCGNSNANNSCSINSYLNYYTSSELHAYMYVKNNPIKYVDPFGLFCGPSVAESLYTTNPFDKPFGYDFSTACERHDYCYDTFGNWKGTCDSTFLGDMSEICGEKYNSAIGCYMVAGGYYTAVSSFGLPFYVYGQASDLKDIINEDYY